MKVSTEQILKLFFNEGESICVSPNKYSYHSVTQDTLNGDIPLLSPNPVVKMANTTENELQMLTINPIKGFRSDDNATAYRSFLIEIDDGSLQDQKKYIEDLKVPYSVCIFSGNKSLHYGIVLKEDLPDYNTWRVYAEWILNIISRADQLTKNPSRSIRFPDNRRADGRGLIQKLIALNGRVELSDLNVWLSSHPEAKPKPVVSTRNFGVIPSQFDIPRWILDELSTGVLDNRNITWFKIAGNLARRNFREEDIVGLLEPHFIEDRDFRRKEWLTAIKSGIKGAFKST